MTGTKRALGSQWQRLSAWVRTSKLLDSLWQYGPAHQQTLPLPEPVALAVHAIELQVDRVFEVIDRAVVRSRKS